MAGLKNPIGDPLGRGSKESGGVPEWGTGADEQELATPTLSLCYGIFTD